MLTLILLAIFNLERVLFLNSVITRHIFVEETNIGFEQNKQ